MKSKEEEIFVQIPSYNDTQLVPAMYFWFINQQQFWAKGILFPHLQQALFVGGRITINFCTYLQYIFNQQRLA
ncbi:MAG: hypothetical protein IT212_05070 [Bacteroidia bacterium]|nr:hypothetical protein [Bacteroidia bacterium]